jgi:Uma2 family endonuclease
MGVSTATLVSMQEYLATSYHPDCDYVDGLLIDRNVGQKSHSKLQGEILAWFRDRRRALLVEAFPEQRVRVSSSRCRIPDVCVLQLPEPDEEVFTTPPYICIEILSPDDTFPQMQDRFDDYLAMGVPDVWALDPKSRRAWRITRAGHLEALDGSLRTDDDRVILRIADLFSSED